MIVKKINPKGLLEYCKEGQPKHSCKKKSPLEKFEQENLNHHCKHLFPEHYDSMFHVVNESGALGSMQYGAKLKRAGRKPGIPDWHVMVPSNGYHGLYIELKRQYKKDGRPTEEEVLFLLRQKSLGYKCVIAYGYECAIEAIKDYFTIGDK